MNEELSCHREGVEEDSAGAGSLERSERSERSGSEPAPASQSPEGGPPAENRTEGMGAAEMPELTKRTILMLKTAHPEWGCQRISDMLVRGPALPASRRRWYWR